MLSGMNGDSKCHRDGQPGYQQRPKKIRHEDSKNHLARDITYASIGIFTSHLSPITGRHDSLRKIARVLIGEAIGTLTERPKKNQGTSPNYPKSHGYIIEWSFIQG